MSQAKSKPRPFPPVELRHHADRPGLDEIVARNATMIHVEQMADDIFWMGIYFDDKTRLSCQFTIVEGAIRLKANTESI